VIISLYIKTHNITGLRYFGKTVKNPFKYRGSGKYWKRHLSKHGNDVSTEVVATFDNEEDASTFAIEFSLENNIVEDSSWANLIIENGKDGQPIGHKGHVFTEDQKMAMSIASKAFWAKDGVRERMQEAARVSYLNGRNVIYPEWTDERKIKHSDFMQKYSSENINHGFLDYVSGERTEDHCKNLSAALQGKPKSLNHACNLAWSKITKSSPLLLDVFGSYQEFAKYCYDQRISDKPVAEIARLYGTSRTAVYNAIKKHQLSLTLGY